MNITLLLGTMLAMSASRGIDLRPQMQHWDSYKTDFNKSYESSDVELMRRSIFAHNKLQIDSFNENLAEDLGFELGLNQLADMSSVEIKARNGFQLPEDKTRLRNSPEAEEFLERILADSSIDVPDELDWRKTPGRVSEVKNQGQCGSCWAFATTGVLEGQESLRLNRSAGSEGQLVELSEQNLVDCVKADYGCNGGIMKDALEYVRDQKGIDDEQSYPYRARNGKCHFDKAKSVMSDTGAAILPMGDEQKLKEIVAKFGPVAVAIDASSIWFQMYHRGVYYNRRCHNKENKLDHGVLVVGYGTDPNKGDYWLVKNSWGALWGDHGYIKMARNKKNNCGIATMATIPTF